MNNSPMSKQNATINSAQQNNGNESESTVKMYYHNLHDLSTDQANRQTNIQVIETNLTDKRSQEVESPYSSPVKAQVLNNSPIDNEEIIQPK